MRNKEDPTIERLAAQSNDAAKKISLLEGARNLMITGKWKTTPLKRSALMGTDSPIAAKPMPTSPSLLIPTETILENVIENSTINVVFIGEAKSGKTSLIKRFTYDVFQASYEHSIGIEDFTRESRDKSGNIVKIRSWDTANIDDLHKPGLWSTIPPIDTVVVLLNEDILAKLQDVIVKAKNYFPSASLVLVRSHADDNEISTHLIEDLAKSYYCAYFLTDAKSGRGVKELFRHIVEVSLNPETRPVQKAAIPGSK